VARTEMPAGGPCGVLRRAARCVAGAGLAAVLVACSGGVRTPVAGVRPTPGAGAAAASAAAPLPSPASPGRPATKLPVRTPSPRPRPNAQPAPPSIASATAYAARANHSKVTVHASPDGPVTRTLANPIPSGAPLTFLLARRSGDWLKVYLPQRPNGSTGWVRASDVRLYLVPYRLDVLRSEHTLRVYRSGRLVHSYPIGVGTGSTPTPGGRFYLKELIRTPNPGGAYGPYAYGLSGFSNVLTSFGGGDGVIGLHGTNDPSSVGRDVSHGCIRLRNSDITALTLVLPLGTPVRILA